MPSVGPCFRQTDEQGIVPTEEMSNCARSVNGSQTRSVSLHSVGESPPASVGDSVGESCSWTPRSVTSRCSVGVGVRPRCSVGASTGASQRPLLQPPSAPLTPTSLPLPSPETRPSMPVPPGDMWATRHTVYAGCVMRMRLADTGVPVGCHQGDTSWHTVFPVCEETYCSPAGDIPGWVLHQAGVEIWVPTHRIAEIRLITVADALQCSDCPHEVVLMAAMRSPHLAAAITAAAAEVDGRTDDDRPDDDN